MRTIWAASTLIFFRLPLGAAHGLVDHDSAVRSANLDPFVPPQSKKDAVDAQADVDRHDPHLMWFIVSKMARPAMTLPPGQLIEVDRLRAILRI